MFKLLPFIAIAAVVAVGYFAWQQYQGIQRQLSNLEASGVDIAYQLTARPVVVYDDRKERIYLAQADRIDEIHIESVKEVIIFSFTKNVEDDRRDEKTTSHGQIVDKQGVIYRFGDYGSPDVALKYFKDIPQLSNRVRQVDPS